jgi:hypothetical protein
MMTIKKKKIYQIKVEMIKKKVETAVEKKKAEIMGIRIKKKLEKAVEKKVETRGKIGIETGAESVKKIKTVGKKMIKIGMI